MPLIKEGSQPVVQWVREGLVRWLEAPPIILLHIATPLVEAYEVRRAVPRSFCRSASTARGIAGRLNP